ncbi:AzlC family ABC transporter permease [Campylobacter lanienae]|uniref:AzlC family ABC transporter permease n=1 Tax=Campylobacter lanienae TaxID=75658 RepID=UPI00242A6F50|nr:AzlC family ABC transporter permease [Campylobacter lanienae]MDD5786734.1 AzlC family ABC transporter permease [Campylobacter lanienae]
MNLKFKIFQSTIAVMMGYIPLGFAFGLYGASMGFESWVMGLTSVMVYAGSVEFLLIAFIASWANLWGVFFILFMLNFRHFFYTLGLLDEIKKLKFRYYFIYALSDETYALIKSRNDIDDENRDLVFNLTAFLNQIYWVFSVILGSIVGSNLNLDYKGIEFSLAALFGVLSYEVFKRDKNVRVALLGFGVGILGLFIFPLHYYLFGSLILAMVILIIFKRRF